MNKAVKLTLAALLLTFQLSTAHAGEAQIVIEDLTIAELRAEIDKIQNEFYRVFNALNQDDNLDIICHKSAPTGSNIKKEACEPQFMIDKRADNASDARQGLDLLLEPRALRSTLGGEFETLTSTMNKVLGESEYFSELNAILGVLRQRLEEISG